MQYPLNTLILSDLHLTEKPEDWYKWKVFNWAKQIMLEREVSDLFILGDVFDKKDKHPAELVNRLVDELDQFRNREIVILKGNHDYIKDKHPFLRFLGKFPNITWIQEPTLIKRCLFLPHTRNPQEEWETLDLMSPEYLFIHQSVIGSVVSNYFEMKEGLDPTIFNGTKAKIYSGDIHVPQVVKKRDVTIEYIGTQYPVAFGDMYVPRALLLKGDETESLHMDTIQRANPKIKNPKEIQHLINEGVLRKKDQVKITIMLSPEELSDWVEIREEIKTICNQAGVEIHDLKMEKVKTNSEKELKKESATPPFSNMDPSKILERFAEQEELGHDFVKVGLQIIKGQ